MKKKSKVALALTFMFLTMGLLIAVAVLAKSETINPKYMTLYMIISMILLFASIFYLAKVDYKTGIYKCRKCGHEFKPTFKAYMMGMHTVRLRYLKCPKCENKSWCIRKYSFNK